MDSVGPRPRRQKASSATDEIVELKRRLAELEQHVQAIESGLRAAGWSESFASMASRAQLPRPGPIVPIHTSAPPLSAAAPSMPLPAPPYSRQPTPVASPDWSSTYRFWSSGQDAAARSGWSAEPRAPTPRPYVPAAPPAFDFDIGAWLTNLGPAKILALVGGGALLLGMAYFLSLAFSQGWIGPEMRVALGLLIGFGLLPAGALLFDRARPTLGHVVVAVGLGTIDLALFASQLYNLVLPEAAMFGALIAAIGAGVIAVRWNSQLVAGMGIAAVLAAPPIVSAPASLVTVAFLGAVLAGTAYVSFRREWHWLPWLSFVLTAPQILWWLSGGRVVPPLVLVVLTVYWALFAISAVVPVALGRARDVVRPILLLTSISAFVSVCAYIGFAGSDLWLRGAFIGALATANLATGVGLVRRRGLADDLAHAGLGLAAGLYVVAFALLLDGPAVPVAWTLVMVANAWVWGRFGLRRAAIVAGVVAGLAAGHLILIEYAFPSAGHTTDQLVPYFDPQGLALAVFLLGVAVAAWLCRDTLARQLWAAGGAAVLAITVPFEAFDVNGAYRAPMIIIGWTAVAVGMLALDRLWHREWRFEGIEQPLPPTGVAIGAMALLGLVGHWGTRNPASGTTLVPYVNPDGAALAFFLAGLAVAGWLSRKALVHQWLAALGAAVMALTVPIEARDLAPLFLAPMILIGWCALGLVTLADDRLWHARWRFELPDHPLPITGLVIGGLALAQLGFGYGVAQFVRPAPHAAGIPFTDEQTLMSGIALITLWALAASRIDRLERTLVMCTSVIVVAFLLRQQLPLEWAVAGWCALATAVLATTPVHEDVAEVGNVTGGGLLVVAAIAALIVAPPSRLWVVGWTPSAGGPPNAATIALLATALGFTAATWRELRTIGTRWLGIAVLVTAVYLLSVNLVDAFAVSVPANDPTALDDTAKLAQVSLTILWAVIGLGLLGYGLARDSLPGRASGLTLLGVATAKAFLLDLAFLDVAYRVLSLVGLGVVLLAGAYGYQRLRARPTADAEGAAKG